MDISKKALCWLIIVTLLAVGVAGISLGYLLSDGQNENSRVQDESQNNSRNEAAESDNHGNESRSPRPDERTDSMQDPGDESYSTNAGSAETPSEYQTMLEEFKDKLDLEFTKNETTVTDKTIDAEIIFSDGDVKVSGEKAYSISVGKGKTRLKDSELELTGPDGTVVTVSGGGVFDLGGKATDAVVVVAAPEDEKVFLIFDGLELKNTFGPALYVISGDKVFISLKDGSTNSLSDGKTYELNDGETSLDATVFSRTDLCLNGSGSLEVNGNFKHGIVSKDDLVIGGGSLKIKAAGTGICGKDCVKIAGGTLDITAGTDGVKSNNDEDENRGYVYIAGGNITIKSGDKGIQSEKQLILAGGKLNITSQDDGIHSDYQVCWNAAEAEISAKDDGIHADKLVCIYGGRIEVTKSYEGIEGEEINIYGGFVTIVASDDGINAAGKSSSGGAGGRGFFPGGGRGGMGGFGGTTGTLNIYGGDIYVDAAGDGVDSNGTLLVAGGTLLINGPSSSMNGAIDYETTGTITSGTVIALGASGMAENFSAAENQGSIRATFSTCKAGSVFAFYDENGTELGRLTATRSYNSAVVSCPAVVIGGTYTLKVDGVTVATVTVSSLITGSGGGFGPGGGGNAPGGNTPGGRNPFGW